MAPTVEERLLALGLRLPSIVPPRGNFRPYVLSGSLLYLSGKGTPLRGDGAPVPKVGEVQVRRLDMRRLGRVAGAPDCTHAIAARRGVHAAMAADVPARRCRRLTFRDRLTSTR